MTNIKQDLNLKKINIRKSRTKLTKITNFNSPNTIILIDIGFRGKMLVLPF